ncbi:MAG TPA: TMEM14 family protein [Stenomitos sp.]
MNNLFVIATWSILVYGVVVLLGGIMGYVKAKSQVSLFSGVGSGLALLVAWFIGRQVPLVGLGLATFLGLVLFIVFVIRFSKTRAFMPAGLMTLFSLAATVIFLLGLLSGGGLLA